MTDDHRLSSDPIIMLMSSHLHTLVKSEINLEIIRCLSVYCIDM